MIMECLQIHTNSLSLSHTHTHTNTHTHTHIHSHAYVRTWNEHQKLFAYGMMDGSVGVSKNNNKNKL